jgi:hypothetical protein
MANLSLNRRDASKYWCRHRNQDVVELIPPKRPVRERVLHPLIKTSCSHLSFSGGDSEVVEGFVYVQVDSYHQESDYSKVSSKRKNPPDIMGVGFSLREEAVNRGGDHEEHHMTWKAMGFEEAVQEPENPSPIRRVDFVIADVRKCPGLGILMLEEIFEISFWNVLNLLVAAKVVSS